MANNEKLWHILKTPISGLAPMHNVTTFLFRELICRFSKPDLIYTEFISAEGLVRMPNKFSSQLKFSNSQRPIVAQLFGIDPKAFSKAITTLHALGFDGVDINMGCPATNLLKIGGGAALINNYKVVDKILSASLKVSVQLKLSISVKTRIVTDDKLNAKWFTFMAGYPINALAIHGRDIKQEHHGIVDWPKLALSAQIIKQQDIVALCNGGIRNREEGNVLSAKYGFDGFLIGQSAIGNPYVFSADPTLTVAKYKLILDTICEIVKENQTKIPISQLIRYVLLCLKDWPNSTNTKQIILTSSSVTSILQELSKYRMSFHE